MPGDLSSALLFIAAALITPDSEIILRNVVLILPGMVPEGSQEMGARIELLISGKGR